MSFHIALKPRLWGLQLAIALGLFHGVANHSAVAQNAGLPSYDTIQLSDQRYIDEKSYAELRKRKNDMIQGAAAYDENFIREYYIRGLLPRMSQIDHAELVNECRAELQSDMSKVKNRQAYNAMVFRLFDVISRSDKYYPPFVSNAILLMGELNNGGKPPVPFDQAKARIEELATSKDRPDYVRAAALPGLLHHTQIMRTTYSADVRSKLAGSLIECLNEPKPILRTDEVHAYLQRKYLDILVLFDSDKHKAVRDFVLKAITTRTAHPALREYCISLLPRIDLKDAPTDQVEAAATAATHFVMQRVDAWKRRLAESGAVASAGYGGGGYMGAPPPSENVDADPYKNAYGGPGGNTPRETRPARPIPKDVQPAEVKFARRQLNQLLDAIHLALDGRAAEGRDPIQGTPLKDKLASSELAGPITDLIAVIDGLQKAVNDENIKDKKSLSTQVDTKVEELLRVAGQFPGVADLDVKKPDAAAQAAAAAPAAPAVAAQP